MSPLEQRRAIVWTAPRCISTAFERAIMELPNGKVFHEPYVSAYYFGPEKTSKRYEGTNDLDQTYNKITEKLEAPHKGKDYVFAKDMAYALAGRYKMFTMEGGALDGWTHTFLMRDPAKAILSMYKASTNTELTGWDHFDESEAGFEQMYELYTALKAAGKRVVVVDCEDLLEEPEVVLRKYCEAIGFDFKPGMSSWQPGPQPDWQAWQGWHDDALKSNGLHKPSGRKQDDLPTVVQELADRVRPKYEEMFAHRIRASAGGEQDFDVDSDGPDTPTGSDYGQLMVTSDSD